MCPGTLALASVAASAGSAIVGGVSAAGAAGYQASVARQNAQIQQQNAQRAAMATASQTEAAGLQARQQDAGVKAAAAANNVDVGTGSAADVETSQRELGAFNTSNVAERGALQTYGYETQSSADNAQANLDQSQVLPDYLGAGLKAGSILGGNPTIQNGLYGWLGGGTDTSGLQSMVQPGINGQPVATPGFNPLDA